jgi:hypothetical protein
MKGCTVNTKRTILAVAVLAVAVGASLAYAATPTSAFLRALRSLPTGDGGFRSLTVTPGRWAVPTSVVVPASVAVRVEPGAKFIGSGGATLDFAGPFDAPPVPIFEGFAVGAVTFSGGATIHSEWWGGSPDGGYAAAGATGAAGPLKVQGQVVAKSLEVGTNVGDKAIVLKGYSSLCLREACDVKLTAGSPGHATIQGVYVTFTATGGGGTWQIDTNGLSCYADCPASRTVLVRGAYGSDCEIVFQGNVLHSTTCAGYDAGL